MKKKKINYKSPIYIQLREVIRNRIEEGEYSPGTAIPSENSLAQIYGINRLTVRNAIDKLVKEGLLKRVHGKGVYVLGKKLESSINDIDGFNGCRKRSLLKSKILSSAFRSAGSKFSYLFGIPKGSKIYAVEALLSEDYIPVAYEKFFIPKKVIQNCDDIDFSIFSTKEIFDFYDIKINTVRQNLEIIIPSSKMTRVLQLKNNQAIMLKESFYYNNQGQIIYFEQSYIRSDMCQLTVNM